MSTGLRQRTRCQHCREVCRVAPLEIMVRGVNGGKGEWLWGQMVVCPGCQHAFRDHVGLLQRVDQELSEAMNELEQDRVRSAIAAGRIGDR